MLRQSLLLLFISTLVVSEVQVYNAKGENCETLLYTESIGLTIGTANVTDLIGLDHTETCSATGTTTTMVISFGDVKDTIKDLKVTLSFSYTDTGYWSTNMMTVSFNESDTSAVTLTGRFTSGDMVSTSFSFACSLQSTTTLTSTTPARKAEVSLAKYQIQAFNVADSKFADSYQCVNWISKGAWMGVFTSVVLIVVLVMSVMMLMSTTTPDRFETSKSKCLIIPHEH